MVSDTPTDGRCNYELDDGYCEGYQMDNGRCYHHGGQRENGGAPGGEENGSYDHGAFSEHFRSDLTDDETDALADMIDALEAIDGAKAIPAEIAAEALMKYKRSADTRFLREARQYLSEFNILENAESVNLNFEDIGGAFAPNDGNDN